MGTVKASAKQTAAHQSTSILLLIGVFKLFKGLSLILVGIGALRLMHRDVAETVTHWVNVLRIDPDNRMIHHLLERVFRVSPHQLRALGIGTFIYAGLFLTEGIGLLLRKRWAEYFTIISTGALIPLELYEIARHITMSKVVILVINVAIVAYLVLRVRSSRAPATSA
jgi:uncharacterized membrane protein (DUF2068 family)